MTDDLVERLARYRPTTAGLGDEWPDAARSALCAETMATDDGVVRFVASRPSRRRWLAPVAASAAVLTAVGAVAALGGGDTSGDDGGPSLSGGGTSFATTALSDRPDVAAGQFWFVDVRDGATTTLTSWSDARGDQTYLRDHGCEYYPVARAGFETPSVAFFADLPTDPTALLARMRREVSGSASQDEAVFVAVGDSLRLTSGLASPRLRAAFVDALAELPETTVHTGVTDAAGRAAVRVDYTDQARRAGELDSLYFDPTDFRLLEQRSGTNGEPRTAPSTLPYGASPTVTTSTPGDLTGPADVTLIATSRTVSDGVPSCGDSGAPPSAGATTVPPSGGR
ncbi:MAG: hypothetical protein ACTHMS_04415 [Jatrophihabitans sp.]|uniref:hypothetical protein n=1 Tax=Jatrophihabitans sp. TaxID=1932789 RepID=UPI003F817779